MPRIRPKIILQAIGTEAALLRVSGTGHEASVAVLATASSARRDPDATALSDEAVLTALRNRIAEIHLTGHDAIILFGAAAITSHRILLPNLAPDAAQKALKLKLVNLLHYDVNQAVLTSDEVSPATPVRDANGRWYRVASVHLPAAMGVCQAVESIGLRPAALLPATSSIEWIAMQEPSEEAVAFFYLGECGSTLVVRQQGVITLTNELPPALRDLTLAWGRPIIDGERSLQLREDEARGQRDRVGIPDRNQTIPQLGVTGERVLPLLEPVLQQWTRTLTQWISFASTGEGRTPITEIVLGGPGAAIPGLADTLAGRLAVPVRAAEWQTPGVPVSFGPALAAARSDFDIPDLLPQPIRRQRRMERGARMATFGGPALAAALLIATSAFWRLGNGLSGALASEKVALSRVESRLTQWQALQAEAARLKARRQAIEQFRTATPRWTGVLKELARVLPTNVVFQRIQAQPGDRGIEVTVNTQVQAQGERTFDDVIRDSLLALQASPFFEDVQVVTAGQVRDGSISSEQTIGHLDLRMRLVYASDGESRP